MNTLKPPLDINEIKAYLPHDYPFLLIDRVLSLTEDSIECLKNVTYNEPFFIGHFPNYPIMPGVLQVEAMAQAAAMMVLAQQPKKEATTKKDPVLFASMDAVKFRKPVVPGDTLIIKVKLQQKKSSLVVCQAEIHVDGNKVSEVGKLVAITGGKKN